MSLNCLAKSIFVRQVFLKYLKSLREWLKTHVSDRNYALLVATGKIFFFVSTKNKVKAYWHLEED